MNHVSGEWLGQYAAYAPWDGMPEPCWQDEHRKLIKLVYTKSLEDRPVGDTEGRLLRRWVPRLGAWSFMTFGLLLVCCFGSGNPGMPMVGA